MPHAEAQTLWGETTCRVWRLGHQSVVHIAASRLKSLESADTGSPDDIAYVTVEAQVADVMSRPPYTRTSDPPSLNGE